MIKETKKGYPKTLRLQTDGSHSQVYRIKGRKECYRSPGESWGRGAGLLGRSCGQAEGACTVPELNGELVGKKCSDLIPLPPSNLLPVAPTGQSKLEPAGKGTP